MLAVDQILLLCFDLLVFSGTPMNICYGCPEKYYVFFPGQSVFNICLKKKQKERWNLKNGLHVVHKLDTLCQQRRV